MKIWLCFFAFVFAVLPAEAQHRGGGSRSIASRSAVSRGSAVSRPSYGGRISRSNNFSSRGGYQPTAPRYSPRTTQQSSQRRGFVNNRGAHGFSIGIPSRQPRSIRGGYGSLSAPTFNRFGRVGGNKTVIINNYGPRYRSPIWWTGGYYGGIWFGTGWYYPSIWYPYSWYWNGWAGYQFYQRPKRGKTGIELDLDSIHEKAVRKYAEDGIVQIAASDSWAVIGSVKRLSKHIHRLEPGTYDLRVVFPDQRELPMTVEVTTDNVTHVPITFSQPSAVAPSAAPPAQAPQQQAPPLQPAPAPSAAPPK